MSAVSFSTPASQEVQVRGTRRSLRHVFSSASVRVIVIVLCILWSIPTFGLLVTSFRDPIAINQTGWWTALVPPYEFTTKNYESVLNAEGMGVAFGNTLLVTIPAVVIPITIAAFAAYAFAWLKFPGRDFLFAVVVVLLVVPLHTALIPLLRLYSDPNVNLNGTFLGIWLAHTGFGLPIAVYLLYGYISTIPKEIMESAMIDGASPYTAFTKLVLPLSVPAIASFSIFQFLWVWNDLLVSLVFLGTSDNIAVITRKLQELVGSKGQNWEVLTAGAFVTMIVPLLIFLFLQRYFVRGLMAGSVKG